MQVTASSPTSGLVHAPLPLHVLAQQLSGSAGTHTAAVGLVAQHLLSGSERKIVIAAKNNL